MVLSHLTELNYVISNLATEVRYRSVAFHAVLFVVNCEDLRNHRATRSSFSLLAAALTMPLSTSGMVKENRSSGARATSGASERPR